MIEGQCACGSGLIGANEAEVVARWNTRWGTPVVAGEVAAHRAMRKRLDGNWVCDGRYWSDGPPSKELVESICSDKDRWRVDVAYTAPQPTQAQAGAALDEADRRAGADATCALRASHGQAPAQTADFTTLGAAMRAIQQAIGLIGDPADERMRAVRRVLRGAVIVAEDSGELAAPAAGAVAGQMDDIDAVALARYKVEPSHDRMFHRFAVVAGDGQQQIYVGRETECQNMARKFSGAFLDGAFYQSQIAAASTPAAQADSVQEDAARYRFLRDGEWRDTDLEPFIRLQLNTLWDAKIDAAMAANGGNK